MLSQINIQCECLGFSTSFNNSIFGLLSIMTYELDHNNYKLPLDYVGQKTISTCSTIFIYIFFLGGWTSAEWICYINSPFPVNFGITNCMCSWQQMKNVTLHIRRLQAFIKPSNGSCFETLNHFNRMIQFQSVSYSRGHEICVN